LPEEFRDKIIRRHQSSFADFGPLLATEKLAEEGLPVIPIPLLAPDGDIRIDLAAVFDTAYERGRDSKSVNYGAPLNLPLNPEREKWATTLANQFAAKAKLK